MRWLGSITNSMEMNLKKLWEIVEDRGTWHAAVHGVTERWTAAYQAPPSMGFSRLKYWSGVPLPSPRDVLDILK